jgi:PHD/YefM family antitoxin component YafN of YafNO toxin-antitoxin module
VKTMTWNDSTSCDEIVRHAQHEDVVLVRDGHAVALVIPFDDKDLEWYAREREPEFLASIARARQQVSDQRTISHQDLKRELGID